MIEALIGDITSLDVDAIVNAANEQRFDRVVACMFGTTGARAYEGILASKR